jgi:hypothetical protein
MFAALGLGCTAQTYVAWYAELLNNSFLWSVYQLTFLHLSAYYIFHVALDFETTFSPAVVVFGV